MAAPLPGGPGLVRRRVSVARKDVAFLRYVLEAHEGLAFMHGDGAGTVTLLAPDSRLAELELLIADLVAEGALSATEPGA